MRILYIDRDRHELATVLSQLERHEVVAVESLADGIREIKESHFDYVIVDVDMGEVDLREVVDLIQEIRSSGAHAVLVSGEPGSLDLVAEDDAAFSNLQKRLLMSARAMEINPEEEQHALLVTMQCQLDRCLEIINEYGR